MMNSAAFRSKTPCALAGAPHRWKCSRDKGLMQGRRVRYCQAAETSRYAFPRYIRDLRTEAECR